MAPALENIATVLMEYDSKTVCKEIFLSLMVSNPVLLEKTLVDCQFLSHLRVEKPEEEQSPVTLDAYEPSFIKWVRAIASQVGKIQAIKFVREFSKFKSAGDETLFMGLKESKEFVESLYEEGQVDRAPLPFRGDNPIYYYEKVNLLTRGF